MVYNYNHLPENFLSSFTSLFSVTLTWNKTKPAEFSLFTPAFKNRNITAAKTHTQNLADQFHFKFMIKNLNKTLNAPLMFPH